MWELGIAHLDPELYDFWEKDLNSYVDYCSFLRIDYEIWVLRSGYSHEQCGRVALA